MTALFLQTTFSGRSTRWLTTDTWNVENQLSQIVGSGGYSGTSTYTYDGDGKRIKKVEGGNTIVYVGRYYEKNITTSMETSHYYLGGQQVAIKKGSTLEYLHQDSLNSTTVSTTSTGAQQSTIRYFPYGATRSSTGTLGTDQEYTGQRLDNTGLYFYNARYYDPNIGRFISPDDVTPDYTNPQDLNRYSYVHNNPLTYNDPTGHFAPIAIAGIVIGVKELVVITASAIGLVYYGQRLGSVVETRSHYPSSTQPDFSIPTPDEFNMWPGGSGPPKLGPISKAILAGLATATAAGAVAQTSQDDQPPLPSSEPDLPGTSSGAPGTGGYPYALNTPTPVGDAESTNRGSDASMDDPSTYYYYDEWN